MKFLVDAQLPLRLARWTKERGHDVVHTRDLPDGNRTEDREICPISLREQRTVVTKDADFVDTLLLQQTPHRLLLVSTGNIRNADLLRLFEDNLDSIVAHLVRRRTLRLLSNSSCRDDEIVERDVLVN